MSDTEDEGDSVQQKLLPRSNAQDKDLHKTAEPEKGLPRSILIRNLVAFWLLGLCNNYAYCIMLSAAHDVLSDETGSANKSNDSNGFLEERDCNPTSTGAILLADVLPSLVIKFIAPFIFNISYAVLLVSIAIILALASFLAVAFSNAAWITYAGVVCASLSSGLGEVTLLRFSTSYTKNVVSTWASGTGMSGVLGSFSYASITTVLSPRDTLLVMLCVPVLMAVTFFFILVHPAKMRKMRLVLESNVLSQASEAEVADTSENSANELIVHPPLPMKTKFILLKPLFFRFILPLALVYLAEYFINQGLVELIYFTNSDLTHDEQYRWYQVIYQVGVFISRSSVNFFRFTYLWVLPILQLANVVIFFCEAYFLFMPNIWIIFILILFEGLLGGCSYVNTFYKITRETEEPYREFSMGATSAGESLGTTIAGFISIPIHDLLCRTPIPK